MTTTSAFSSVLVGGDEVVEVRAADFLLALEHHLDVDRQRARLRQRRLDGLEVHEDLALVVGRPARVDRALADGGLEGRRLPQVQRIDRLHVVVPVEQHRRRAGRAEPLAVHDRMSGRLVERDVVQADALQFVDAPLGAAAHVGRVRRAAH